MTAEKKTLDEVKIRPMESRDISAVLEFDQRLSDAERATTYDEPYTLDQGGSLETSFVAETKGQVVGFIMARFANPGEPTFGEGLIQTIAIDPEYHPTEIATRLVNAFLSLCRSNGIGNVHVIVNKKDNRLQSLLVSLGFSSGQLVDYTIKV